MPQSNVHQDRRGPVELALLVAALCVAVAVALQQFAGVSEDWLVIGTIAVASCVGWAHAALRPLPTLQPVAVERGSRPAAH